MLVGDISALSVKQQWQRNKLRSGLSLLGRVDLQKHFVYSMALQLFSTSNASDAMGELKEFFDASNNGSGFSFADLLADRAGTRFAMLATASEMSAMKVQRLLDSASLDRDIMPMIVNLPEGLDQQAFERYYQDINSSQYKSILLNIDKRLALLDIYSK